MTTNDPGSKPEPTGSPELAKAFEQIAALPQPPLIFGPQGTPLTVEVLAELLQRAAKIAQSNSILARMSNQRAAADVFVGQPGNVRAQRFLRHVLHLRIERRIDGEA